MNSKLKTAKFRLLASLPTLAKGFVVSVALAIILDFGFQRLFPEARAIYSPIRPILIPLLVLVFALAFFLGSAPSFHLPAAPQVVLHEHELHRIRSLIATFTGSNSRVMPWSLELLQNTAASVSTTSTSSSISLSGETTIGFGYLLLKCLTSDEAIPILLHEIGHATLGHCELIAWTLGAQTNWYEWFDIVSTPAKSHLAPRLTGPRKLYYGLMSKAYLEHRRASEYDADAFAAQFCGKEPTVRALILASSIVCSDFPIHLKADIKARILMGEHINGWPNANPHLLLFVPPEHLEQHLRREWAARGEYMHPSLGERVRALIPNMTLEEALSLANNSERKNLKPAAEAWFDKPVEIQERVNEAFCCSLRESPDDSS